MLCVQSFKLLIIKYRNLEKFNIEGDFASDLFSYIRIVAIKCN